ncbi:MAG: flippase-like domain-containing protein, partial [Burkholderiaceae bacterium]|nr:flippase-like domain-containing protein [Burkholderiaceae bacterium]
WLLAGLLAAMASNMVSALRWQALARWLGTDMRARDACRWYFQAIGLNALLPGAVVGGDVYRAVMLRRAGQDTLASSWSVLLDRISGVWMLCATGGLGAAACAPALGAALRVPPTALAALALAGTSAWLAWPWCLPALLRRWGGGWLAPLQAAAMRPGFAAQLGWQMLASVAVQGLSAAALAAAGLALGIRQPLEVWAFAIAPVFLMAALPVSVGGWGTREAAAVAALAPFGVAAPAAVGTAMIYGLYGIAQGALGALAFGLPPRTSSTTDSERL